MRFLLSVLLVCVLVSVPGSLATPAAAAALDDAAAVIRVVDPVTGVDSGQSPLQATAGQPFDFALRMTDAGDVAKGGWEVQVTVSACLFELAAPGAVVYGDFLAGGSVIFITPMITVEGQEMHVKVGQFSMNGGTTASSGTLAVVTLTPRRSPACGTRPTAPVPITLSSPRLASNTAQDLPVEANPGLVAIVVPLALHTFLPFIRR